ncbi:hypothetical protein [Mesonia sp. K4-1]|uniref:hypothetical protein n=1 Tax=Mesonia sp. K4-1 TaxID=2602760 RepID=UPI0016503D91|nr:hypothetical protein [Mesonia sp. K4-1]
MINNIFQDRTIAEYLMMQEDDRVLVDAALEVVKPKKTISLKYNHQYYKLNPNFDDMFFLKWKEVSMIKDYLNGGNMSLEKVMNILKFVYKINTRNQFFNCSVFDVFAAYAWILEGVNEIFKAEKMKLFKKPTHKQINAGIEDFDQLGEVPSIDNMASGNILKWDEVQEMPYGLVMRKMLLNRVQSEYEERLAKQK